MWLLENKVYCFSFSKATQKIWVIKLKNPAKGKTPPISFLVFMLHYTVNFIYLIDLLISTFLIKYFRKNLNSAAIYNRILAWNASFRK